MKKICPVCGGKEFVTTAHITHDWKVNDAGEWLETVTDCVQIDHGPDPGHEPRATSSVWGLEG